MNFHQKNKYCFFTSQTVGVCSLTTLKMKKELHLVPIVSYCIFHDNEKYNSLTCELILCLCFKCKLVCICVHPLTYLTGHMLQNVKGPAVVLSKAAVHVKQLQRK